MVKMVNVMLGMCHPDLKYHLRNSIIVRNKSYIKYIYIHNAYTPHSNK